MDKKFKDRLLLIVIAALLFAAVLNIDKAGKLLNYIFTLILPVIVGLVLAFVLSVPMNGFENLLAKIALKRGKHPSEKALTFAGFFMTAVSIVTIAAVVLVVVIPQLAESAGSIMPRLEEVLPRWIDILSGYGINTDVLTKWAEGLDRDRIIDYLTGSAGDILASAVGISTTILSGIVNAVFGIILSVYVLLNRKTLARQSRKLIYAYCKTKAADKIVYIAALIRTTFTKFISGQCVEAVILALMIFISFSLAGLPYAGLTGVLTGVFAFIPYVGAFAACGTGAFLMLLSSPSKALLSVAVFLAVQFIEGHFIYPYVVGNSVGLPALWTLVAALLGGRLFGIIGMIFFIPLTSVIYTLAGESVNKRLVSKGIKI